MFFPFVPVASAVWAVLPFGTHKDWEQGNYANLNHIQKTLLLLTTHFFCLYFWNQVLNKVITVYAALCCEIKKLKYEVIVSLL